MIKIQDSKISKGGIVNKGKNALTKRLRKKSYLDEDITNFRLIESGLDEKNIEKSKRFYKLGLYRGADMILDAIKNEKIKVKKDKKGVYFTYDKDKISSERKLKIKSGDKTLRVSYKATLKMHDYFVDR